MTTTNPTAAEILSLASRSDRAAEALESAKNWQDSTEPGAYARFSIAARDSRAAKADFDSAFASFVRTAGSRERAQDLLVEAARLNPESVLAQQILARK